MLTNSRPLASGARRRSQSRAGIDTHSLKTPRSAYSREIVDQYALQVRTRKTSDTAIVGFAIAVLAVFAVVAVVVVGGLGMSRTDEVAEAVFDPAQITDAPIVVSKRESGGFKLLGLEFDAPDRWLSVAVKPPPDCLRPEGGEETVVGGDGCDAVESVAGPVRGGGITAQGERWVELWVEVDLDCHRAATVGDPWSALPESCR